MAYYNPFYNQNNDNGSDDDEEKRRPGPFALLILVILFTAVFVLAALYAFNINDSGETTKRGTGYYYDVSDAQGGGVLTRENIPVFNNNTFSEELIAPGASGEYTFNFINSGDIAIKYGIEFSCTNEYNINIVYKLKTGDDYICGSDEEYISIADLELEERTISAGKADTYTLYWYWEHNNPVDTEAGINSASYTLTLTVNTRQAV